MTNPDAEQPTSGIAVLANDVDFDDGPFQVRGVALPEDITTSGNAQGEEVYWSPDVVEEAAAMFEGAKITDPSEHDPQTAVENPQPSPKSILGEIDEARYEPGTGVVYEGEVDDPEVAKRVQRGRVEVSPTIFRTVEDSGEPKPVSDVKGVRDLSVVAEGQAEGNKIEPATAAMSALSAEALSGMFAESMAETKTVAGVTFSGTATGTLDESELDKDEHDLSDHYLYGSGEDKEDFGYPVVDADGDLRRGNVDSAWELGCRGKCDDADAHDEKLLKLADEFDNPPEWAQESETMGAESPADPQSDDGTDEPESPSSAANGDSETMSDNELTESEKAVLAASEDIEEPASVLKDYQAAEQPTIVEQSEIEAMESRLDEFESVVDDRLAEETGLSEKTVEAMSLEAKVAEFEDEDGNLEAESLIQVPETEQPDADLEDNAEVEALVEEVGADDKDEAVETLREQYQKFERAGWESQAEEAADKLETLGVEV